MKQGNHLHWLFCGIDKGQVNPANVEVRGYLTEADARAAAEELLIRDEMKLVKVWECSQCANEAADSEYRSTILSTLRKMIG